WFLLDQGDPVLALTRAWPAPVPGLSAYLPRGPIAALPPRELADRIGRITTWLGEQGVDVVTVDPEVAAETRFGDELRGLGFHQIEELEPSRHRMDVALPPDGDEAAVLRSFRATTRNLIRQAEREGLVVQRLDRAGADATPPDPARDARLTGALYDMLDETARRRRFRLAAEESFLRWASASIEAGLSFALVVERPDGEPIAGGLFYRHGVRLTYALSAERAEARRAHPGAGRLQLWRAMQVALAEGRTTMDLGGVDVRGARRMPREGEPEYGLMQFKESFGARWVELTGAHERVLRPRRYAAGRALGRVRRLLAR
ncbi:MAG TPA: GNAT family N-acetyltransferase, partial [Candidatus Acidoferrales bacterium]|nr:GNAT family N-acetyltransferase [Candidatus Acidoferrales bacterium]